MFPSIILVTLFATTVWSWLPGQQKDIHSVSGVNLFSPAPTNGAYRNITTRNSQAPKIRGVNLGSYFVIEPWMIGNEWASSVCADEGSEFDCVQSIGQDAANSFFETHWDTYITEDEIQRIASYGLNTIRIPLGYWILESLIDHSCGHAEHFPMGGFKYLERLVGWASDAGLYIILDLHGAPGAQVSSQPFTGQIVGTARFYKQHNYDRAIKFFAWLAETVHSNDAFRNVGMLQLVNEPTRGSSKTHLMNSYYYPKAYETIREVEAELGVSETSMLHVQFMNEKWGSGNPTSSLQDRSFLAYDDHRYVLGDSIAGLSLLQRRYIKYDSSVNVTKEAYLLDACNANRDSGDPNTPTIVGEWSVSVADNVERSPEWDTTTENKDFYTRFFAAQVTNYEATTLGWIFWSWKTQLNDYRWSYSEAVEAGVIPWNVAN
ncbi:putative glucan endo-1,6-beta-glucosidase B, partial [Lachnellula suecica]